MPYREYLGADPSKLAQDTLHELPGQLLGFMNKHGIKPQEAGPPPPPPPFVEDAGAGAGAGGEQARPPPPAYM